MTSSRAQGDENPDITIFSKLSPLKIMNTHNRVTTNVVAALILMVLTISGCGNDGKVISIVEERDSLKKACEAQQQRISEVDGMITALNGALDSIAMEEGMLFTNKSNEVMVSRSDVLHNLERYEQVLKHQKDKIRRLEGLLADKGGDSDLKRLVAHMKGQLADKDAQIANLRSELSRKDVNISQLRRQVESQLTILADKDKQIAELGNRTQAQTKALVRQDEIINKCYVLIGSKSDLKRKGVVRKNRLLADAALDKSKFAKVDIRKFREISFTAKRPRILTDVPQSAYTLTTTGNHNFTLRINDATAFWSISNFLVIQTD